MTLKRFVLQHGPWDYKNGLKSYRLAAAPPRFRLYAGSVEAIILSYDRLKTKGWLTDNTMATRVNKNRSKPSNLKHALDFFQQLKERTGIHK